MKKAVLLFIAIVSLTACKEKVKPEDISKINGYWEIETVTMPDGNEREYKISETIDYFEIKCDSGFRKKVMPQFDGKYLVNDKSEKIKIVREEDKIYLNYATEYSTWKEEVLEITDDRLVLKNEAEIEYQYKKPTPFTLK
ncbi:MAG: hypothetical protein EOO46_05130 [Flavobacterium sp.]|nr:MAG: hypothetical protein EOO46_05130 [Flavobacterium sp.]